MRWIIHDAKNSLLGAETLLSGQEQFVDTDKYRFTVSMELSPTFNGGVEHSVNIQRLGTCSGIHVFMRSFIEKAALVEDGYSSFEEVDVMGRWPFHYFRRDDLLDDTKGLIVNDTLTIVLQLLINVGNGSLMRLADDAEPEQPAESALARAFNSEFLSDVVLRSSDGRQFRAHKIILAVNSPVFSAMFDSGLKESTQSEVEIADCSAEVVEQMLSFIYTGATPEVGDDNLFDLLKAADKYDIKDLLAVCENKIAQSTDSNNAAEVLILADTFGAKKLKESAMDWIVRNISDVMKSPGWKTLSKVLVEEILGKVVEININQKAIQKA